ncbi:hypothetical protein [Streptomyces sp. NPDC060188]|uniref:hypothetical protein n=1 Tax=Streptomyces sp. NPDC060188 TaxID=3347068 RepID=UPI003666F1AA
MSQGLETGAITGAFPAHEGLTVMVTAPAGTDTAGIPHGGTVIAWALIADGVDPGGAHLEPVFLAEGRAWTATQYRVAFGLELDVRVGRAR